MSNISSQIAAGVSQALVQQGQAARQRDAVSNADRRHAQKLRDLLEQHVHEVEDTEKAEPDRLYVDPEQRESSQQRSRRRRPETPASATPDEGGHIDIEA